MLVVVAAIAVLAWCAFWARWWLPAVPATVALVLANSPSAVAFAVAALLGVAAVRLLITLDAESGVLSRRREASVAVGLLAGLALAGMRDVGFVGSSALVAVAAALPVVASGVGAASEEHRRAMRLSVSGFVAVVALILVGAGAAAVLGGMQVLDGVDATRRGVDLARDGDQPEALAEFRRGEDDLRSAHGRLTSWWAKPASLIPVVGPHLDAAGDLSGTAVAVVGAAADAVASADIDDIRAVGGRIDLDLVRGMRAPLDALVAEAEAASESLGGARSAWLLPPLERELDDLAVELDDRLPDLEVARDGVALLPDMLGANGERRYLMLFGTTSEAREAGGLLGNFVEVVARDGDIRLGVAGRNSDLNDFPGDGVLADPSQYPELFVAAGPGVLSQDYTRIVDFPTMARAANELYSTMGGRGVDGVAYLDPVAIAAFLRFTGPLESAELGRMFAADNVLDFLLREQYESFEEQDDRKDFLTDLSVDAFDRLLTIELPGPDELIDVFGPVVRRGSLVFTSLVPEEAALVAELGLDGAFPSAEGGDLLSVVHVNKGSDKLDAYTRRSASYVATLTSLDDGGRAGSPAGVGAVAAGPTGRSRRWSVEATVTVRFRNEVQPAGLPSYVIGPLDRATAPPGVNLVEMSVYTPWDLAGVTVDGVPVPAATYAEFGAQRHVATIGVEPSEERVFEYMLRGTWEGDPADYALQLASQPLVHEAPFEAVVTADGVTLLDASILLDEDYRLMAGAVAGG